MDRQRHAVHQGVSDPDGHDGERPQGDTDAGNHLVEIGIVEQPMLFQLALDESQCELSSVNRNVQLRENPRQTADVVFMPVGQQDSANL